jgi:hypothetical protein
MTSPNDSKGIRINRRTTNEELAERNFELTLPGRLPDEVLGEIAQSGLAPGLVQAVIGTVVVMLAWTAMSAFFAPSPTKVETATVTESAAKTEPAKTDAPAEATAKPAAQDTPSEPSPAATAKAGGAKNRELQPPGPDEAKAAPADVNPLENSADDLLKDLK